MGQLRQVVAGSWHALSPPLYTAVMCLQLWLVMSTVCSVVRLWRCRPATGATGVGCQGGKK